MMNQSGQPPPYPGFPSPSPPSPSPFRNPMGATPPHPMQQPQHHPQQQPQQQQQPPPQMMYSEEELKQRTRFQIELEFVQCLGNPNYLHFLAQRGYFKEPNFINYLKYLLYWKEAKYVNFIKYPVCLHFLELLQHEAFRKEIVNGQCAKFLDDQVILSWQHYARKRVKLIENAAGSGTPPGSGAPGNATTTTNNTNAAK